MSQNVLETDLTNSLICSIWCQSGPIEAKLDIRASQIDRILGNIKHLLLEGTQNGLQFNDLSKFYLDLKWVLAHW